MGITLNITVSTPLSEEDDNILAGTAIWLMAVANRNGQQEQEQDEEELGEPMPCGFQSRTDPDPVLRQQGRPPRSPQAPPHGLRGSAELTLRGGG